MRDIKPEIITYFCDACGVELKGSDKESTCSILMTSDGLDYSGCAVGPGSGGNFDCCYNCYSEILEKLNKD